MNQEAAKEIASGMAWFGFWLAAGAYGVASVFAVFVAGCQP